MALGRIQMEPGISFHPGKVISHTQNACRTSMRYCATNNATTPGEKGLSSYGKDGEDGNVEHNKIFFCRCQGVTRTTVNTIDILPPQTAVEKPTIIR